MSDSHFNKVVSQRPVTLSKKRLQHRCVPVNFKKFSRVSFFIEHLRWLLLYWQLKTLRLSLFSKSFYSFLFLVEGQQWKFLHVLCYTCLSTLKILQKVKKSQLIWQIHILLQRRFERISSVHNDQKFICGVSGQCELCSESYNGECVTHLNERIVEHIAKREKCPDTQVLFGPYFPVFRPEKTPYLDIFHAVLVHHHLPKNILNLRTAL